MRDLFNSQLTVNTGEGGTTIQTHGTRSKRDSAGCTPNGVGREPLSSSCLSVKERADTKETEAEVVEI